MPSYFAVDLGASGGRVAVGRVDREAGRLHMEIVHRFANGPQRQGETVRWDLTRLIEGVEEGLTIAAVKHGQAASIGCDAWGLDHGFIGHRGQMLERPFSYQDSRTSRPDIAVGLDVDSLRRVAAAPHLPISTMHQLVATRLDAPGLLQRSAAMLFIADLMAYHLCGIAASDPCIASTSQLYDWRRGQWYWEAIDRLHLPRAMFPTLREPGSILGALRDNVAERVGLKPCPIRTACGHDTAAAVAAAPVASADDLILCTGTWFMLGFHMREPLDLPNDQAIGIGHYRLPDGGWAVMHGVMGLHLLERFRREENEQPNSQLVEQAKWARQYCLFDPQSEAIQRAASIRDAITAWCRQTDQITPRDAGEFVRSIIESLAVHVREVGRRLACLAGRKVRRIVLLGGGARNSLLAQAIANATEVAVVSGEAEAAALGNIMTQAIGAGDLSGWDEARCFAAASSPLQAFEPQLGAVHA